jgi:HD-like signal output (HDOD) protein
MLERADEKVAKILKSLVDIPSLPAAVQRLLLLSEKDSTPGQFADLIATDQGLTAKVLRLVNSAFYSLRTPISSLRHASVLLGTRTLKSLALSVSVMNLFNRSCGGFDPLAFWKHSIAVAVASQKMGALILPALEEDLYVAGLLHDTGVALMVQYLTQDYALVLRMAKTRPLAEAEVEVFGVSHADVGYTLATRWRLPAMICESIRYHETPGGASKVSNPEVGKAIELTRFADQWAIHHGMDFLERSTGRGESKLELPAWAAVASAEVERILENLGEEVAARERAFFPQKEPANA